MDYAAELAWAKLAGHDYKVSIFQYQEIIHHMDPEFRWIILSAVGEFLAGQAGNTYSVYGLFICVAKKLLSIISEREKYTGPILSCSEIADSMFRAYTTFPGHKSDDAYEYVETFLIYGIRDAIILLRFYAKAQHV